MIKWPKASLIGGVTILLLFVMSAFAAHLLTPALTSIAVTPDLDAIVPEKIGEWTKQTDPFLQVGITAGDDNPVDQLYDKVLMRSYRNANGDIVMLALAYAKEQTQDIKIHRPEVCYDAQGFTILQHTIHNMPLDNSVVPVHRLLAKNNSRTEIVSYWVRIGDKYPNGGLDSRLEILRSGLKGKILDGILVRVSTVVEGDSGLDIAYDLQEKFLVDLLHHLDPQARHLLVASN